MNNNTSKMLLEFYHIDPLGILAAVDFRKWLCQQLLYHISDVSLLFSQLLNISVQNA
jgi:hypothetical protein